MPEVIAVLCSDLHLSHKPPVARSTEPDWYEAMARPLREMQDLVHGRKGYIPVLCGGDIFDKWNSPPELVSFAIRELPERMWSVMGQHDLPHHNWEERTKSAFWTLVEAKKIMSLKVEADGVGLGLRGLNLYGFPWGMDLRPSPSRNEEKLNVAVAHRYCWTPGEGGVRELNKEECMTANLRKQLQGYDVALFGDNHRGFVTDEGKGKPVVFNAGTLMRRASNERDYNPMVGLLYEDGSVKEHHLDTSQDKFLADSVSEEAERTLLHLEGFLEGLEGLGEGDLDFEKVLESAMIERGASRAVRRIVLEAMEKKS